MKIHALTCAVLCMAGVALADGHADLSKIDVSKLPTPATQKDLSYDKDIKPLLDKSCGKCHGTERPKGRYRVISRENFIKGGESGPAVVPGQSQKSPALFFASDLVEEMEMPPKDNRDKFPALTKEQLGVLRAWIDQGAK